MSVTFVVEDRVASVTLNRPERMNAVDAATERELDAIWEEIEARDDISCVVLTGAGERAFCAGADLKGLKRPALITGPKAGRTALEDWPFAALWMFLSSRGSMAMRSVVDSRWFSAAISS